MTLRSALSRTAPAISALLALAVPPAAHAQVWQVTNAGLHLEGDGFADVAANGFPPFGVFSDVRSGVLTNYAGSSYGNRWVNKCEDIFFGPPPDDLEVEGGGEAFVSNALVRGRYVLRACIVNFHTTYEDVEAIPEIVVRTGRSLDARMREGATAT